MESKKAYIVTLAGVLTGLAASWFIGYIASDKGWDRVILRVALALIVIVAGGLIVWFLARKAASEKPAAPPVLDVRDELELILRDAEAKIASAKLRQGDRFGNYPVFFVLGPPGSAKTTAVIQSGLEPELLAGQVYEDAKIAPTISANLWYAKESIFVEPGTRSFGDPALWSRLLRRFEPGKLKSVVRKGAQPPRAVVACYDVESLLGQPPEASLGEARNMRSKLSELSRAFGISVPVYVLFTKLDRARYFQEYANTFDDSEAAQVFGAALPLLLPAGSIYGQEQTAKLNRCFEQLFYSLSNKRPELLAREGNPEKTPDVYEFPREFRKIRAVVVPFLVELCRPSQLAIGPFLRGFYFTGVRPVLVREVVAAAAARQDPGPAATADANATRMFRPQDFGAAQRRPEIAVGETTTRRVPQWVFLPAFFQDVLLADRSAMGLTGRSTRTDTLRRILLGTAAVVFMVLSIAFIVSFEGNRGLVSTALRAANGIAGAGVTASTDLPSLDALNRLESLRQSLETLTKYETGGAPTHLRWGLYTGTELYPNVRRLYFDRFRQLLLQPIQQKWVRDLKALPSPPGPNDTFDKAYKPLRAYLITTSNHEYSAREFLSPQLADRWTQGQSAGDRLAVANKQFDFYSDELKRQNPFPPDPDPLAIKRARDYLGHFEDFQRVYRAMLANADKKNEKVNFNETFKGSEAEVINSRSVTGAFTKGGWAAIQDSIKNPDSYLNGEEWVLGKGVGSAKTDREKLLNEISTQYWTDYVSQWRGYLAVSTVKKYEDPSDAVQKLGVIASAQSPLMQMFCLASHNTDVDSPDIQSAFKALHSVLAPQPTCDQLVFKDKSNVYMSDLNKLELSLEPVSKAPTDSDTILTAAVTNDERDARLQVGDMALNFGGPDPGDTIKNLLNAPISNVDDVFGGAAQLNKKGAGLCQQMSPLAGKYPFKPDSKTEAKLSEVNDVFLPKQGVLWKFYDNNLAKLLIPNANGSKYTSAPGAAVQVQPKFIDFLNAAKGLSDALYPNGSADPHLIYTVKALTIDGISGISLDIDGHSVPPGGKEVQLSWPEPGAAVKANIPGVRDWVNETGPWAIFRFFNSAPISTHDGALSRFEWRITQEVVIEGSTKKADNASFGHVKIDLYMGTSPPVFAKGYFAALGCVATVATVPK